jgi:hypothetical protein
MRTTPTILVLFCLLSTTSAALDELLGPGYEFHTRFADNIRNVRTEDVLTASRTLPNQCVVTISTNAPRVVVVKEGERHYDSFPPVDLMPCGIQHDAGGAGE